MQNLRRKVFELSDRLFIQTHELQRVVIIDERRDVDHLVIFLSCLKKSNDMPIIVLLILQHENMICLK